VSAKFEKEILARSHVLETSKRKLFCVLSGEVVVTCKRISGGSTKLSALQRISYVFDHSDNDIVLRKAAKGEIVHLFDMESIETSKSGLSLSFSYTSKPKIRVTGELSSTVEPPDICSLRSTDLRAMTFTDEYRSNFFFTLIGLSVQDIAKFSIFRGATDEQLKIIGPLLKFVRVSPRSMITTSGSGSFAAGGVLESCIALPFLGSFACCPDDLALHACAVGTVVSKNLDEIGSSVTTDDTGKMSKKIVPHTSNHLAHFFQRKG